MSVMGARPKRFRRLSALDRMFLHLESPDWPAHFGGLAVVESLDGGLALSEIQDRLNQRLARVPQLRRRLHFPGLLGGPPLWVDDVEFDIKHQIHVAAIEPPGDDRQFLDAAARLYGALLDRRRPLWELWLLTGLSESRTDLLLKLHHSVADGLAAVAIIGSLFDFEPDAPDPDPAAWAPEPTPPWRSLAADNVSMKIRALGRAAMMLAHPVRVVRRAQVRIRAAREALGQIPAPRTSLNQPVRSGRRIRFLHIDLGAVKDLAHAHGAKVNDIALELWTAGLRRLMLSREEATSGVELITNMPVSLRSPDDARTVDNELGIVALPLPVDEPDAHTRLERIVRVSRLARSEQNAAAIADFLAFASSLPLARFLSARQHSVNVKVTNVIGPPVPVYALGCRVLDILPITRLFGNVGLTLAAFSYAGRISLVVTADATVFPDIDVLVDGMRADWQSLAEGHAATRQDGTGVGEPGARSLSRR